MPLGQDLQKTNFFFGICKPSLALAGNFIQKNASQITKELKSPKHITDPVIIYTYDSTLKRPNDNNKTGANYALAKAVETALEQIVTYNKAENKPDPRRINEIIINKKPIFRWSLPSAIAVLSKLISPQISKL